MIIFVSLTFNFYGIFPTILITVGLRLIDWLIDCFGGLNQKFVRVYSWLIDWLIGGCLMIERLRNERFSVPCTFDVFLHVLFEHFSVVFCLYLMSIIKSPSINPCDDFSWKVTPPTWIPASRTNSPWRPANFGTLCWTIARSSSTVVAESAGKISIPNGSSRTT